MIENYAVCAANAVKNGNAACERIGSREFIQQIKGIAIIIMIVHHAFGFPSFYNDVISYPAIAPYATPLASATKICVSLYAYVTGYTYCLHKDKSLGYSIRKIVDFLLNYWVVYAILLAVSMACGYRPSVGDMLLELIGRQTVVMTFCWYVTFYILSMLLLPLYARLTQKISNWFLDGLLSGCFYLAIRFVNSMILEKDVYGIVNSLISFFPVILSAYLLTKYGILDRIYGMLAHRKAWSIGAGVLLILASMAMQIAKGYVKNISIGVVSAPALLVGIALTGICTPKAVSRILTVLGRYSMNIWFLHCLFFAGVTKNVFQNAAYLPRVPVLVVCWILLLCTLASVPVDKIQRALVSRADRLLSASVSPKQES